MLNRGLANISFFVQQVMIPRGSCGGRNVRIWCLLPGVVEECPRVVIQVHHLLHQAPLGPLLPWHGTIHVGEAIIHLVAHVPCQGARYPKGFGLRHLIAALFTQGDQAVGPWLWLAGVSQFDLGESSCGGTPLSHLHRVPIPGASAAHLAAQRVGVLQRNDRRPLVKLAGKGTGVLFRVDTVLWEGNL